MRIQHNIMAMNAYRNYTNNVSAMKKNLEKLSSGYKINRAGDDAAGLAISEKMRAQITGLETAQKNAKDGISLVQTAEGALTEVHDMLNRMVELATQSANGTYDNTTDRYQMQKEVDQLLDEINRIADSSNFNGINLLDGTLGLNTDTFEVGESTAFVAKAADTAWSKVVGTPHGGTSTPGVAPSFKIDLSYLEGKAAWASVATNDEEGAADIAAVTIKLTVGGTDIAATLAASAKATEGRAAGSATKGAIATAFNGKTVAINGLNFTIANASGVLTFTATKTASTIASTDVTKFKAIAGGNVELKDGAGMTAGYAAAQELNYNHAVEDITDAKANAAGGRLGVDIDIKTLLADGNKLKIDDKEYTFSIKASATKSANVIGIDTKIFTTASAQLREALVQLSNKDTTNFDIEAKGDKLHIDAKNNTVTKSAMLNGISGTIVGNPAKAANTKLIVSGTAKEGNVLTIGTDKVELKKGDDADAIAAAIRTKGYTVTVASGVGTQAGKKILTVNAKTAAASVAAPRILGKGLTLQIGDTSDDFNQLNVLVQDMHADSLGIKDLKIDTEESAQKAIQKIKNAINTVSDVRGTLGATQNRLDHTINNLSVMTENIQDAESTIRDTDVAEEMMAYTKNNILIQSAQAMLAQANQVPQGVLQLLG